MNIILKKEGIIEISFLPSSHCIDWLITENYFELDNYFKQILMHSGQLFNVLCELFPVSFIEHMIAIRQAPDDEDGIWHDDGSRLFGFSLSLNLNPSMIVGGELEFKNKNSTNIISISPRPYGQLIVFLTGQFNYEHRVKAVTSGKRIVIAGWGS